MHLGAKVTCPDRKSIHRHSMLNYPTRLLPDQLHEMRNFSLYPFHVIYSLGVRVPSIRPHHDNSIQVRFNQLQTSQGILSRAELKNYPFMPVEEFLKPNNVQFH